MLTGLGSLFSELKRLLGELTRTGDLLKQANDQLEERLRFDAKIDEGIVVMPTIENHKRIKARC